jgi:hypothetical protein
MTVLVCDDACVVDIAEPSYRVLRLGFLHIITGRGMLLLVGSELEAAVLLDELERV